MEYNFAEIETPIGTMKAFSGNKGIFALDFCESKNLNSIITHLSESPDSGMTEKWDENLIQLKKELAEYFSGVRKEFGIRLSFSGTDFQKRVWSELMKIPYGETRTYSQQASALNDIKALRAVASANGKNKIAILVPCHRVLGSDGSLTGYAGGLWRKKFLLELESKFETTKLFP